MDRHIKVRAALNAPANTHVNLTILSRTHKGGYFSKEGKSLSPSHHSGCFGHRGVVLISTGGYGDAYFKPKGLSGKYLVFYDDGPTEMRVPIEYWPDVKACIEEYNRWGATADGRTYR